MEDDTLRLQLLSIVNYIILFLLSYQRTPCFGAILIDAILVQPLLSLIPLSCIFFDYLESKYIDLLI